MLTRSLLNLGLTGLLCITAGVTIAPTAQAQKLAQTKSTRLTFKEQFDQRRDFLDQNCAWQRYQFQGRGYRICAMEDVLMAVAMDGPENDNGPTAYFQGEKLFSFRDTGLSTALLFDQKSRLLAEVEVGFVAPEFNKITTEFTAANRKELTDRATESSQQLLKVGRAWQRSQTADRQPTTKTACKVSRNCVYGPEVSDRWAKGDQLTAKADFKAAITEYQKALKASETLKLPNQTAAQLKVLRACAINSSQAQLAGLKQAKDFQATHMITAENHKMALQVLRDQVRDVMAEQDAKFPELVGKCP
jgi:hypothetical protein